MKLVPFVVTKRETRDQLLYDNEILREKGKILEEKLIRLREEHNKWVRKSLNKKE